MDTIDEAIEWWRGVLPAITDLERMVRCCEQAIADLTFDIASARHGWPEDRTGSPNRDIADRAKAGP